MNRQSFLMISAGTTVACVLMPNRLTGSEETAKKPNLLIIHTDEHNFRTLGCYRDTLSQDQAMIWGKGNIVETPHIDNLAKKGALCTNFYASTPVCSPSRASFISGQYPQKTPVVNNNIPLNDNVVSFAKILGEKGYKTGYVGKWHLDGDGKPQWEPKRKFGFQDNRFMFNRGHWKQLEDTAEGPRIKSRKGNKPDYGVKGADSKSFTTDWLADKTVGFIKENKDKPFCFMVSIPDPHGPDSVRHPYDTMYEKMKFQKPETASKPLKDVPSWAQPKKGRGKESQYFGMVKCIDDNVGEIMAALKENGILENTIVVFTADHGDLRGEHGRQNKGVPLEASAKVPFILYYPKKVKEGTKVEEALSCIDFLPTVLGLMGVDTAGKEDGRDASELFTGYKSSGWKDITIIRGTGDITWVAAIDKRYKLILSPKDQPWLIDKVKDPDELTNFCLTPESRKVVRRLGKELGEYHKKHNDPGLRKSAKLKYDLDWTIGNDINYDSSKAPKLNPQKTGKKRKKTEKKVRDPIS